MAHVRVANAGYDWKGDARNIGHHGGCSSRRVLAGIVTPENEACKVSFRGKVPSRVSRRRASAIWDLGPRVLFHGSQYAKLPLASTRILISRYGLIKSSLIFHLCNKNSLIHLASYFFATIFSQPKRNRKQEDVIAEIVSHSPK